MADKDLLAARRAFEECPANDSEQRAVHHRAEANIRLLE